MGRLLILLARLLLAKTDYFAPPINLPLKGHFGTANSSGNKAFLLSIYYSNNRVIR